MKDKIEIIIDDEKWNSEGKAAGENTEKIFSTALNFLRKNNELEFLPKNMPVSINLCLSNDEEIHQLNKEFRQMDKPTNVLSFANVDDEYFFDSLEDAEIAELGDIIIAFETLQREAKIENISFEAHYAHLLVHGILHLCGFDHIEDDEAEYMEDLEVRILSELGIANPYKDRE